MNATSVAEVNASIAALSGVFRTLTLPLQRSLGFCWARGLVRARLRNDAGVLIHSSSPLTSPTRAADAVAVSPANDTSAQLQLEWNARSQVGIVRAAVPTGGTKN